MMDYHRHILQVFVGAISPQYEALSIEVSKQTTALEIVACIIERLGLPDPRSFELAEVIGNAFGQDCKERRLGRQEAPVALQLLWPQSCLADGPDDFEQHEYRFCLREKVSSDSFWAEPTTYDSQLIRDYFYKFLYQPKDKEYPDLCQLTNLNEQTLMENLKVRFQKGHIYTYVGSILISVNPFKYYPIYNPKYVKLYQNHRLGELPPHIFAIADSAYHSMLKQRKNQCIVISGESGSGKTEATLFLLHHLTMLSQKGSHGSGVEQTILSSGPVLEAFGNAKTAHNNNSSRFGKFIQVSYRENGLVQGACLQKYLLEKSRICSQAFNERSYHVFYYLLAGATSQERQALNLLKPVDYRYLNQSECFTIEGCDEQYEYIRLKQSMEMVGFTSDKQLRLFAVLSGVLLLGNIEFSPKKSTYHHDESVSVKNFKLASIIASLLGVSEDTLVNSLTSKKVKVQGETLVMNYRLPEALAARDALAKCLYGALFDWIVLQVNYSLISLKESSTEYLGNSIGVLDIFGFEDFGNHNRFEQFCINYANEHLQHYFNQHVFEYEQEEYRREGISWTNIAFQDNIECLALIEGKPAGILCILDDQCSFPGATNENFLQKTNSVLKDNKYYEIPQKRESAFIIKHYAGKVKYQVEDIREKNLDLMRPELISVLKNSQFNIVRELAGSDPVAVFRWAILRAFFRAVGAFQQALRKSKTKVSGEQRRHSKHKLCIDNSRTVAALENNQNRLRKTRHNRSKSRAHGPRNQKNLKTVMALAQRTQTLTFQGRFCSRKTFHTVTGQFQLSLQALMVALNQANPYFIRCIKSNANKEPNMFDNELVQRQLRYTGMLETVRIRQAGFNVRMTYDEFIHHYRILLPNGLVSSQAHVKDFLKLIHLDACEYQTGYSKIFMRESQKQKLDSMLHQTILSRIIQIQRWYRSRYQRRHFVALRLAVIRIQAHVRSWLAQQVLNHLRMRQRAAICIQRVWRGYRVRRWYKNIRQCIISLQARVRGNRTRERFQTMLRERSLEQQMARRRASVKREDVSSSSVATDTTEINLSIASETQEVKIPPPRRKALSQNKLPPIERTLIDSQHPFAQGLRRSSVEAPTRTHPPVSRRLSETTLLQNRRLNQDICSQESNRRSEERLPCRDVSPPPAPAPAPAPAPVPSHSPLLRRNEKNEVDGNGMQGPLSASDGGRHHHQVDGNRPFVKDKSFRHRPYKKVPAGIDSVETTIEPITMSRNNEPLAPDVEKIVPISRKFPKIKKHLIDFVRWDGSVSESDDNSCESSSPRTPTTSASAAGHPSSFPALEAIGGGGGALAKTGIPAASMKTGSLPDEKDRYAKDRSAYLLSHLNNKISSKSESAVVKRSGSVDLPLPASAVSFTSEDDDVKKALASTHHNLKQTRKGEICSACDKPFTKFFINPGYKCITCKKLFHIGCLKNSLSIPCQFIKDPSPALGKENASSPSAKKPQRIEQEKQWSLTGTSQFIDKADEVIKDAEELKMLDKFLSEKIYKLESEEDLRSAGFSSRDDSGISQTKERKDSQVDQLFCQSLRAFKSFLFSTYSIGLKNDRNDVTIKYKDLIKNFEQVINNTCQKPDVGSMFPVTMGVNAFRGFLDEFIKDRGGQFDEKFVAKKKRRPRKKKKQKKVEDIPFGKHNFHHIMVNIPTQCEVCHSFLWLSMKALTCQKCKATCHQKCLSKVEPECNQSSTKAIVIGLDTSKVGATNRRKNSFHRSVSLGKIFGIPLENLVSEESKLPPVVERLFSAIELHGLYTEGLYRKPGAATKVRELKGKIDQAPDTVSFVDLPIHVLTAVLKSYLRELPEPLLTYDSYDPLLHASFLEDREDMYQAAINIIKILPIANYDLFERLMFHLSYIAHFEHANRMNSNALAIVFTPCIIRSPRSIPVQDSVVDISKLTEVVEILLRHQLIKTREVMRNIESVDSASITAEAKLLSLRSSKNRMQKNSSSNEASSTQQQRMDPREALALYKLEEEIQKLEEAKQRLALDLPSLARGSSEEDLLSTDMSRAGSFEDISTPALSMRSVASNISLVGEEESFSSDYIFRRRDRRSMKSNSDTEDITVTSLSEEYSEDAVMV